MIKLNIGSGGNNIAGWINIDMCKNYNPDIVVDVTKGLPYDNDSVDFIFSEHFLEHITYKPIALIIDFHRVLKKDGVIRTAVPDLEYVLSLYTDPNWRETNSYWLPTTITTRGEMLHMALNGWGHKYTYNEEDLCKLFDVCGFNKVYRTKLYESKFLDLCNLECRETSKLIVEAIK